MGGLPSKQMVNGVGGQAQARTVGVGDRLRRVSQPGTRSV